MDYKSLFGGKALPQKSKSEIGNVIESSEYISEFIEKKERFVPPVDFSNPENFCFYGNAEEYYTSAIRRIYSTYPYDGSLKERLDFENSASNLDNYILNERYPRFVGYATLHTGSLSSESTVKLGYVSSSTPEYINISQSLPVNNIYDSATDRLSNLLIDGNRGNTIEFWMKKDGFLSSSYGKEVLLDVWSYGKSADDSEYGRLKIELRSYGMPFLVTYRSGSNGFYEMELGGDSLTSSPQLVTSSALATSRYETNAIPGNESSPSKTLTTTEIVAQSINDTAYQLKVLTDFSSSASRYELISDFELGDYIVEFDSINGEDASEQFAVSWLGTTAVNLYNTNNGWTRTFMTMSFTNVSQTFRFYTSKASQAIGDYFIINNLSIHKIPASSSVVYDGNWHHYAFNFYNSGSDLVVDLYMDGIKRDSVIKTGAMVSSVTGNMQGRIGTLGTDYSGSQFYTQGPIGGTNVSSSIISASYGQLSASIDEFRFWRRKRTPEQIARYYFTQVGGGTNTDDANTELGVYYKFNEGNTGIDVVDSFVLDYSGRLSNGSFSRFTSGSTRQSGSAIIESGVTDYEFRDPIIYDIHPSVQTLINDLTLVGQEYDYRNNSSIYRMFPKHMIKDDQKDDKNELLELSQIFASYFDTAHLQIKHLPRLYENRYYTGSEKPAPFEDRILASAGFIVPDIFLDADVLEFFSSRNEEKIFREELYNIKNSIYKNLYNNAIWIYKAKGTEKAFRNAIRCFGIDDELLRVNLYSNYNTFNLESNYRSTSFKKKYVNFAKASHFSSVVYSSASILGASAGSRSATYEVSVLFPRKAEYFEDSFFETPFVSCSLFGTHGSTGATDPAWEVDDRQSLQVFAVKTEIGSPHVYFKLTGSSGYLLDLTSSVFYDVYDNNNWNISVRISPAKDMAGFIEQNDGEYLVEFYGVNHIFETSQNSFYLTGTISNSNGLSFLTGSKRTFIGAHRQNFTGTVVQQSDVKIGEYIYWGRRLENEELAEHSKNISSFGSLRPSRNAYGPLLTSSFTEDDARLLHWRFDALTSSRSDGTFDVIDFSSSSYNYDIGFQNLPGYGYGFDTSSSSPFKTEHIQTYRLLPPNVQSSDSMINILETDNIYTKNTRPLNYFFSIEKSMQQAMSDEMLRNFATIRDFHNLIGEPVNRYRDRYKKLDAYRRKYFDKLQDVARFERFLDFYKWIDSSVNSILAQLVPATADFSTEIGTVVESHVFERNKYQFIYPETERKEPDPVGRINGINLALFDWNEGHRPVGNNQEQNILFWKTLANPTEFPLASGDAGVDASKFTIYAAKTGSLRSDFNKPYRFEAELAKPTDSSQYQNKANVDFVLNTIKSLSQQVLLIEENSIDFGPNTGKQDLFFKKKISYKVGE